MFRPFLLSAFVVVAACGGAAETSTSDAPDGGSSTSASRGSGSRTTETSPAPSQTAPASDGCCTPDATRSGCMQLGGASFGGQCYESCDFFCSTNWRIEKDAKGCDYWRYDIRAPEPGENSACFPMPDGG